MADATEATLKAGAGVSAAAGLLASISPGTVAEWIERVGFPIACLCAIGWAGLRMARWLGARVVEPIAARHVSLMATLEETQRQQTEALKAIAGSEAATLSCVQRIEEASARDRECAARDRETTRLAVERVGATVDRLAQAIEGTPPR